MKQRRILVVGGLAAGPSAAAQAKRSNPRASVTLFEASETVSYGICEVPYVIGGVIQEEEKLVAYSPQRLQEEKGIQVKTLHCVEAIYPTNHTISVRNLKQRTVDSYEYDKLILATGSRPRKLGIEGEQSRNVFSVRSRQDTRNILTFMADEMPKHAVIIGGGYIGMEMAEALRRRGVDVTIIHRSRLPLAGLELTTRERILEELQKNEVHFVTNARIEALTVGKKGTVTHVQTNRGTFDADIVIVAIGVEPANELARDAKIRLGTFGGILPDERQQTNVDDIYAAGDCCEVKNIVSGKSMYLPLATLASRAARVAGINAAGGRATFKGAIRAIAVQVFGLEVAQVGLSSEEAVEAGFQVETETITGYDRIKMMPESSEVSITLMFDSHTGQVLGANVFGGSGAVHRANTLGVAIQQKLTLNDVNRFDMIYAPPFAPLWDPVLIAASQARKKMDENK